MDNSPNLSGPGFDLTNKESGYNILHPGLLLLPSANTSRAAEPLQSSTLAVWVCSAIVGHRSLVQH